MHIRRLTPSPTEISNNTENSSYLVSLRPRELQDQIVEALRLNDLPLITQPFGLLAGPSLDFQIIQRLLNENSRVKSDLIGLSLASYRNRGGGASLNVAVPESDELQNFRSATTLIDYLLAKLNEKELLALKDLLKVEVIDDTVIGNLINFIRLTGIGDPLKFVELFEKSLYGTINLRSFMGTLENATQDSLLQLDILGKREVSPEIISVINSRESQGLLEINARADAIETERLNEVDRIRQAGDMQRIFLNTGITFGISSLVWAGYRFGVWEWMVTTLSSSVPRSILQNGNGENESVTPGFLNNLQLGLAGLTGFFLKKSLLRR